MPEFTEYSRKTTRPLWLSWGYGFVSLAVCLAAAVYGFSTVLPVPSIFAWVIMNVLAVGSVLLGFISFFAFCTYVHKLEGIRHLLSVIGAVVSWIAITCMVYRDLTSMAPLSNSIALLFACTALPLWYLRKEIRNYKSLNGRDCAAYWFLFTISYGVLLCFVGMVFQSAKPQVSPSVRTSVEFIQAQHIFPPLTLATLDVRELTRLRSPNDLIQNGFIA